MRFDIDSEILERDAATYITRFTDTYRHVAKMAYMDGFRRALDVEAAVVGKVQWLAERLASDDLKERLIEMVVEAVTPLPVPVKDPAGRFMPLHEATSR